MGLIFWIDQNTFATKLLEQVFKKRGLEFYTINSVGDFSYLLNDLKPSLIVLDYQTFLKDPEAFNRQCQSCDLLREIPLVILDGAGADLNMPNIAAHMSRPFDPFEMPEQLQKILTSH